MITFKQFLDEGYRSGVLYHFLNHTDNIKNIVNSDKMSPSWTHNLSFREGRTKNVAGVSMTRNPKLTSKKYNDTILLVFDANKLSSNNKIVPLDGDVIHYQNYNLNSRKRRIADDWREEFVVGEIRSVSRKLKKIVVFSDTGFKDMAEYAGKHKIKLEREMYNYS